MKKKLLKAGKPKKFIDSISEDKFLKRYKSKIEIEKIVIIAARILIMVQTKIPEYIRTGINNKCIFNGFQGENGIDYMTCILEMTLSMEYFDSKKIKTEDRIDIIKEKFNEYYNKYKSLKIINNFEKEEYIKKQKNTTHLKHKYKNDETISKDELEKKIKTIEVTKKINTKLKYLIQVFIDKVTSDTKLLNEISTDNYYIDDDLKKDIKNINSIYNNYNELNKGHYNFLYLNSEKSVSINNILDINNNDKYLLKEKNKYYISDGKYKGEKRHYVNIKNEMIDIKTTKKMSDIINEDFSVEKYKILNNKISKLNKIKYKNIDNFYVKHNKSLIDLLNNIKIFNYESEYNKLVTSIAKILNNNNKEFITKYTNFFKRLSNIITSSKINNKNYYNSNSESNNNTSNNNASNNNANNNERKNNESNNERKNNESNNESNNSLGNNNKSNNEGNNSLSNNEGNDGGKIKVGGVRSIKRNKEKLSEDEKLIIKH